MVSLSKVMHGCPGGENPDEYGVRRESEVQEDEFCYCYNNVFIGFAGHQILGVKNTGLDGDNFYKVVWRNQQQGLNVGSSTEKEGFVSMCGQKYYVGSQNFKEVCAGARLANDSIRVKDKKPYTEEEYLAIAEGNDYTNIEAIPIIQSINVWPNPNNGSFKINVESIEQNELTIKIIDVVGKTVAEMNVTPNEEHEINLDLKAGIYYIVTKPNKLITKKLIIQ